MFKRRDPVTRIRKAQGWFWPEMGWRRASRYLMYRIGRLPGSGYAIAGGFAWGAAMSFTPLIGLHILLSIVGAWLTRCSPVAAVIGTVIGNPWTFPFIWIWLYKIGVAMGFGVQGVDAETMDFSHIFANVTQAFLMGDWKYVIDGAMPVLTPMFVGAVPTVIIVWITFFLLLKPVVDRYKSSVVARKTKRAPVPVGQEQESVT